MSEAKHTCVYNTKPMQGFFLHFVEDRLRLPQNDR